MYHEKTFEDSGLLIKDVTKPTKNDTKEQRSRFLAIFFCTLGASSLRNVLVCNLCRLLSYSSWQWSHLSW